MGAAGTGTGLAAHKLKGSRKKLARLERLAKDRDMHALVAAANGNGDLLSSLDTFSDYCREGLDVQLSFARRGEMALAVEDLGRDGLTLNEELADTSRLLLIRERRIEPATPAAPAAPEDDDDGWVLVDETPDAPPPPPPADVSPPVRHIGVAHIKFAVESKRPALCVLEVHLAPEARNTGLHKFVMELLEQIGRKYSMATLLLTVPRLAKPGGACGTTVTTELAPAPPKDADDGYEVVPPEKTCISLAAESD